MSTSTPEPDYILKNLIRIHEREEFKKIYIKHIPIGLGGQLTIRIEAFALALAFNLRPHFESEQDEPYIKSFDLTAIGSVGHPPADVKVFSTVSMHVEPGDVIYDRSQGGVRNEKGELLDWIVDKINKNLDRNYQPREIEGLILRCLKFEPVISKEVAGAISRLGITDRTIGVHYRRGDKKLETPYIEAKFYESAIASLAKAGKFDSVFIASDSANAPNEISLPEGIALIFDSTEKRYNNANHKMLRRTPELRTQETITAMKNIFCLCACGAIVGQDNAHFANLAAASITSKRRSAEEVLLFEHQQLLERMSWSQRRLRQAYWFARNSVKRLIPSLTVTARTNQDKKA